MEYITKIWREERFNIPVKIVGSYVLWKVFHHFAKMPGTVLGTWWERLVFKLGAYYAVITVPFVRPFMDHAFARGIGIYMTAGQTIKGVLVQDHCLAIPSMVVFTATIIFFRGPLRDKVWFIPLGLLGIVAINTARLAMVCLAFLYNSPYYFEINHSVFGLILLYGFVFMMLAWWIRRHRPAATSF
ncbi:MAG: exosortase/archaeosortase family protein [Bacteroidetes bacterium]|nr:exosortase/archaeosortase family protein [Bacteroidota bacterium]